MRTVLQIPTEQADLFLEEIFGLLFLSELDTNAPSSLSSSSPDDKGLVFRLPGGDFIKQSQISENSPTVKFPRLSVNEF